MTPEQLLQLRLEDRRAYDRARSAIRRALVKASANPSAYSKQRAPTRVRRRPTSRRLEAIAAHTAAAAAGTVATRLLWPLWGVQL